MKTNHLFLKVSSSWLHHLHCHSRPALNLRHCKGGQAFVSFFSPQVYKVFHRLLTGLTIQAGFFKYSPTRQILFLRERASVIQIEWAQNLLWKGPFSFLNNFLIPHVSSKQVCMMASVLFHTFLCHSPSATHFWLSCDKVTLPRTSLFCTTTFFRPGFFSHCLPPTSESLPKHSPATLSWGQLTSSSSACSLPPFPFTSLEKRGKALPQLSPSWALLCMQWHQSCTRQLFQEARSALHPLHGSFYHTSRWPP